MNNNGEANNFQAGIVPSSSTLRDEERSNCFCFESDDDSMEKIRLKHTKRKLARGCLSNMVICVILVGYTFLGAVIFLAIEGGTIFHIMTKQEDKKVGEAFVSVAPKFYNLTTAGVWLDQLGEESRTKAVENIWEITVSLNILYKDNWTRLAYQEISKFQEALVKHLTDELNFQAEAANELRPPENKNEWTLARAFLYSLTVLTTIGYGNMYPKSGLGKAVTMGYAAVGIPLVLLYLSSVGSLLSSCARNVFTRSLCCCLCSNCGYCCYDEKRMQEKEQRMRKKRERREYEQQVQSLRGQEPFYVRSSSAYTSSSNIEISTVREESSKPTVTRSASVLEADCLSTDTSVLGDAKTSFYAPLLLCLIVMVIYIGAGAVILCRLENSWTLLDSIFFCFTILSTIGFGDSMPNNSILSHKSSNSSSLEELTIWFFSLYIICGLALTAMCFNVVHEEIVHRLKHHYIIVNNVSSSKEYSVNSYKMTNQSNINDDAVNTTDFLSIS
ncbi:TWiK family of potassium channels protein 7-like [Cimex lectularius]|uniref:Potassium channel domain-containing protein n=1 Tax=Cimex lectularius TaxID=79782 RepID=A0A8I6RVJ3_CIMLE|nr:TWiK family of potassium channels protein 7-like [Cimex lectularius]XP_024084354.1 TWiK family of potassium channels protein 7-like [Cimex lectularius]